jgi:hypothetical protein
MELHISGYSQDGKAAYGHKCEFIGCGWDAATCDVHHINYREHQMVEDGLREAYKTGSANMIEFYENRRLEHGFREYNRNTRQLPKDDRVQNLSVLCPNHHRYLHDIDMGMDILQYIPKRIR